MSKMLVLIDKEYNANYDKATILLYKALVYKVTFLAVYHNSGYFGNPAVG